MRVEYKVINVLLASDPEKLTYLLNEHASKGWHLFSSPVWIDQNSVQLTFEREWVEGVFDAEIKAEVKGGKRKEAFIRNFGKYQLEE
jgi:hypothetical protein